MKEVEIYLSSEYQYDKVKDIGSFGYVIHSDTYQSFNMDAYYNTSGDRIELIGAIEAMKEIYTNIGPVVKVILYAKQSELVNNMICSHCKKFKNLPNQDLNKKAQEICRALSVYVRSINYNDGDQIKFANELALKALKADNPKQDMFGFKRSNALPLF